MKQRRRLSKTDIIIIAIVIITAIAGIAFVGSYDGGGGEVIITIKGETYKTAPLVSEEKQVIEINDTNVVIINNEEVYMESANCEDQICVNHDVITDVGQSIVCLPNEVVVQIKESVDVEDAVW